MIGDTGDFSIYTAVDDATNPPDVISQFGTDFGVEDGWCEEMQGMGFFKMPALRRLPTLSKQKVVAQKKQPVVASKKMVIPKKPFFKLKPFGEYEHPMAGHCSQMGYDGQMGLSLADFTKQITSQTQAALDKAKADLNKQLEAAKQKEIQKLQAAATQQVSSLITKAQTEASKAIQTTVPKIGTAAQTAVVKVGQSPTTAALVSSGVQKGLDEAKGYIGGLVLKYGPVAVIGGAAALGLGVWYLAKRSK